MPQSIAVVRTWRKADRYRIPSRLSPDTTYTALMAISTDAEMQSTGFSLKALLWMPASTCWPEGLALGATQSVPSMPLLIAG